MCAVRYWLSISFLTLLMIIFVHVAQPWIHMGTTFWAVVMALFVFIIMTLLYISYFKPFFKIIPGEVRNSIFLAPLMFVLGNPDFANR